MLTQRIETEKRRLWFDNFKFFLLTRQYACLYGDFELVKYLLLHNANPWLEDKYENSFSSLIFHRDGKTCVDYALKAGQHQIKQFVSSWMKTNKPESMKIYLSNSADLKPFLSQSFAIPKGIIVT